METSLYMPDDKNALVIVAIGLSGSGISTTVDSLINPDPQNTCHPSNFRELEITVRDQIIDKSLTILDTPGFKSSAPDNEKIKALAEMQIAIDNVCEKNAVDKPNIVLVVSRFDDNRVEGHASSFARSLRAFETIAESLYTTDTSNVVFVLTHGGNYSNEMDKICTFNNVIASYTNFGKLPFPIVVVENCFPQATLFKPNTNEENISPNGFQCPIDIWKAIFNVVKLRDANLENVTQHFGYLLNNSMPKSKLTETEPISDKNVLQKVNSEWLFRESVGTEGIIKSKLEEAWEKMDSSNKSTVENIATILYVFACHRIRTLDDIPTTDYEIAQLSRLLPNDRKTAELLKAAFDIEIPILNLFNWCIGAAYNVNQHIYKLHNIFEFDKSEYYTGPWGYRIPQEIKCSPVFQIVDIFKTIPSEEKYVQIRNHDIGVGAVTDSEEKDGFVYINVEPGYNILPYQNDVGKKFCWLREFRRFELSLSNGAGNLKLSKNFTKRVNDLPPYSAETKESYREFFDTFGTHVVKKCFAGGQIQMTGHISKTYSLTRFQNFNLDYKVCLPYWWTTYNWRTAYLEGILKRLLCGKTPDNGQIVEVKFRNGKNSNSIITSGATNLEQTKKLKAIWMQQAERDPIVLTHNLQLEPISEYIMPHQASKKLDMIKAYNDLYGISNNYCNLL